MTRGEKVCLLTKCVAWYPRHKQYSIVRNKWDPDVLLNKGLKTLWMYIFGLLSCGCLSLNFFLWVWWVNAYLETDNRGGPRPRTEPQTWQMIENDWILHYTLSDMDFPDPFIKHIFFPGWLKFNNNKKVWTYSLLTAKSSLKKGYMPKFNSFEIKSKISSKVPIMCTKRLFSSVRSSSGYHGLIEIRNPLFQHRHLVLG